MKNLKELVSIKSFDTNQNKEIIDYLIKRFTPYAQEMVKVKSTVDNREGLIVGLNTKVKDVDNALILSGHIDTVVADEQKYNTDPYTPTIIGDKMYGLGTIDMKSYFGVILDNIEQIKNLSVPVIIAITGDEETEFNTIERVKEKLIERKVFPKLTIVGEPTNMKICSCSKSCAEYCVEVQGKSCHSSMPQNGINANYILARLLLYIEKLCSRISNTTISANIIQGGEKINIVSGYAKLKFDIRSDSVKNTNKILSLVKNYIKRLMKKYNTTVTLTQSLFIYPLEKGRDGLVENICSKFGIEETGFTGGCEAGYFQSISGDAFVFGVGDLVLAHKPNEFVNIKEYEQYGKLLLNILKYYENL